MNKQQILDAVVAHARKQKVQALETRTNPGRTTEDTYCMYRTPDGRKCFVGCLIPDDMYKPEMENKRVHMEPFHNFMATMLWGFEGDMHELETYLTTLQMTHDYSDSEAEWERDLARIAEKHSLSYTTPDAPP